MVDRLRARFPVSVSEVAGLEDVKRAVLGVSTVGHEGGHLRQVLDAVVRDVESLYVAPVVGHEVRVIAFDDFEDPAWHDEGPDPFTRELLAGDPGDKPDGDDAIEDAPWATPSGRPGRAR